MTATKETKECPYCYSQIDARATVCPHCQRDQPKPERVYTEEEKVEERRTMLWVVGGIALLLVAYAALSFVEGAGKDLFDGPPAGSATCSAAADRFQERADHIMADYIVAHRTGEGSKALLRAQADALTEPGCAGGAKAAMLDWFDAVDAGDQQGMHDADERYLTILEGG